MNFRNISSWCIRNPVFPIVLFVGLMLAGLIAFFFLKDSLEPLQVLGAAVVCAGIVLAQADDGA